MNIELEPEIEVDSHFCTAVTYCWLKYERTVHVVWTHLLVAYAMKVTVSSTSID